VSELIEPTSKGLEPFSDNALQVLHHIQVQLGLTPRQYPSWVANSVRRGDCGMRILLIETVLQCSIQAV
jgi:hypothetical protein